MPSTRNAERLRLHASTSWLKNEVTKVPQMEDSLQKKILLTHRKNTLLRAFCVIMVMVIALDLWCPGTSTNMLTRRSSQLSTYTKTSLLAIGIGISCKITRESDNDVYKHGTRRKGRY